MNRRLNYSASFRFRDKYPLGAQMQITANYLSSAGTHGYITKYGTQAYPYFLRNNDAVELGYFADNELGFDEDTIRWATYPIQGGYSLIAYQDAPAYLIGTTLFPPSVLVLMIDNIKLINAQHLNTPLLSTTYIPRWKEDKLIAITVNGKEYPVRNPANQAEYGHAVWE